MYHLLLFIIGKENISFEYRMHIMDKLTKFKSLHHQDKLLFLPNAWDVLSAMVLEQSGFEAIGTTSWGVARAMGYEDCQRIEFDDLFTLVEKITLAVEIPLTVDIESGYSDNHVVASENVLKIADLGAVGINIEDSLKTGEPSLNDKYKQGELLAMIRNKLDSNGFKDFFINARLDTYLQKTDPFNETVERANHYVTAGADGIFVPGLCQHDEIKEIVKAIDAPLNVMSLPDLTDSNSLSEVGVKRFSLGFSFSDATISFIEENAEKLFTDGNSRNLYTGSDIRTAFK